MTPGGTITRKDIVSDDALQFGGLLVAEYEKVIKVQKELVDVTIKYAKANASIRKVENQQQFIDEKQKIILLDQQALSVIKQTQALDISSQKIKQETIKTLESERKAKQAADDAEKKAQNSKKETIKLTIDERVQNELNNKILKQEALERLGLVSAYTKLNNARTQAKNTLRDLIASENASNKQIKEAEKNYEALDKKVRKADAAVGDFTKNVGNYPFKNITSGLQNLIGAFGVTSGIAAFSGIMKGAYETTKQFEQGVADLSAITGASGKDLQFLKNQAIDLGTSTKGGAIAVVEAYKLIASAKPELLDNVQALNEVTEATIRLSQASGLELPEAATKLTDAMNQFGAPASEAAKYVDVLAAGAKYGSAEIPQLTDAILQFGAVAKTSNVDIKESTSLVELLAEKGQKGAEAGTKIRNILLQVLSGGSTAEARKEFDKYGISIDKLKDKTIPFSDKLELLKPLLKDVSSVTQVFGKENATAAISLLENTERLKELTIAVGENGVAEEQAAIRMDTVTGKTEILSATYDSLILSIGKGSGIVSNFFKFFIDGAKGSLDYLIRLNTAQDELNKKANQEGLKDGKSIFEARFNFLGGNKKELSEIERKNIRLKISEIQKEIEKGNNDPKLLAEKNRLINLFPADKSSLTKSIKDNAKIEYKRINKELIELQKESKNAEKNPLDLTIENKGSIFYNNEIERLTKAKATQQGIIQGGGLKQDALKNPLKEEQNNNDPANKTIDDKANKEALAKQKKFIDEYLKALKKKNDDEFELSEFRLNRAVYYNELVLNDEKSSLEDQINASLNIEDLRKQIADGILEKELQNIALSDDALKNKSKKEIDQYIAKSNAEITQILRTGKLKENASKDEILVYEKYILEIKKLDDKSAENKQKLIDKNAQQILSNVEKQVLEIDTAQKLKLSKENDFYQKQLDAANGNNEKILKAKIDHEERLLDIKKQYALQGLQIEIDTLQNLIDSNDKKVKGERISADEIAKIKNKLAGYILEKSNLERENYVKNTEKKEDIEKEFSEKVKLLSKKLKDDLVNFANQLLSNKISNIDNEISQNETYYSKQIELAGNDKRKKEALEKEKEKKSEELEKKKKKAEYDQAVINKAIALATIALNTAIAVSAIGRTGGGTYYADFGISAGILTALTIAQGVVQAGIVLATPLPKYKYGRNGGPEEMAIVGDGGRNEIIERKSGILEMTPRTNTLVKLFQGDKVHSSVEAYENQLKKSMFNNINFQNDKMKQFQANTFINVNNDKLIDEMRMTRKAVEKNKINVIFNSEKIDINHQLWKMRNTNWN